MQRDYTGVPAKELATLLNRYFGDKEQRLGAQTEDTTEDITEVPEIDFDPTVDPNSLAAFSSAVKAKTEKPKGKSDMQTWCEANDLPVRSIRRIRNQEYQFTGLHLADKICVALGGPHLIHTLTVIPAENAKAALDMARDEAELLAEMFGPKVLEPAAVAARAQELRDMRDMVLGEKTEYQKQMLRNDVERSQRRAAVTAG